MLANLRALFGVVVDIVLLRRGPEHLPASPALLVTMILLYAAVAGLVASSVAIPEQNWPLELAIVVGVTLLWYQVALRIVNKRERFLQTLSAMFAVRLLFAPLAMPLMSAWINQVKAYEETKAPPSSTLGLLALFVMLWLFVINARIVRGAFDWPWFPAVLLALGQEFAMLLVLAAILGGTAQPS
jgi:hypothetical protein